MASQRNPGLPETGYNCGVAVRALISIRQQNPIVTLLPGLIQRFIDVDDELLQRRHISREDPGKAHQNGVVKESCFMSLSIRHKSSK